MITFIVEGVLFFINLLLFLLVLFSIFIRYSVYENPFSPLNLYLSANILIFIIFILSFIGFKFQIPNYIPESLDSINLNITFAFHNILLALSYLFLRIMRYKPIETNQLITIRTIIGKYDIYVIGSTFVLLFFIKKYFSNFYNLDIESLSKFRYDMSHGYIVIVLMFIFPIFNYILLSIKERPLFYFLPLTVFLIFGLLYNARGFFVFPILFVLSFLNISSYSFLKSLIRAHISKKIILILFIVGTVLIFYYVYSINFRGQMGNPIQLVLQRMDSFLASYLVVQNNLIGFKLQYILYPFIYLIPREVYHNKMFPPNGDLSQIIFGANLIGDNAWSVNFGAIGEALFVSSGFLIILQSFIIALSIKSFSIILQKKNKNYIDFCILASLYTYPFSIFMGGILTPNSGQILIYLYVALIYYIINSAIKGGTKIR